MQSFRLFGTPTSPYVRRVRVVARELGVAFEFIDAAHDDGQAAMRAVNPLWKVPTAEIDGQPVFDSRVINAALLRAHGPGPLRPVDADDLDTHNTITVIDGVLDALINAFYLGRDGVQPEQASYMAKQRARARAGMDWLEGHLGDPSDAFDVATIALCTTLEWMRFRGTYAVDDHPGLVAHLGRHAERPSMLATRPPGYTG